MEYRVLQFDHDKLLPPDLVGFVFLLATQINFSTGAPIKNQRFDFVTVAKLTGWSYNRVRRTWDRLDAWQRNNDLTYVMYVDGSFQLNVNNKVFGPFPKRKRDIQNGNGRFQNGNGHFQNGNGQSDIPIRELDLRLA